MVLNDNKETFDRRASKWFNFILSWWKMCKIYTFKPTRVKL